MKHLAEQWFLQIYKVFNLVEIISILQHFEASHSLLSMHLIVLLSNAVFATVVAAGLSKRGSSLSAYII